MPWLKLIIAAKDVAPGNIELLLESLGAEAITLEDAGDDPQLEPGVGETPLWRETLVSGLFPAERRQDELLNELRAMWPGQDSPDCRVSLLEDRDWGLAWADHARPMCYGERLWVCPTDQAMDLPAEAVKLIIPPGLAFGTGSHPTTALCLQWLSERVRPGMRVMDYGSGSGILAVAAARLGAEYVLAVDNDPQALTATRNNARANEVEQRLGIHSPEDCPQEPVDLLVANILANPLIELAPRLSGQLRVGGEMALTGILSDQAAAVAEAYAEALPGLEKRQEGDWVLLHGRRQQTRP